MLCRELADNDSAVFAMVENLQREDLNAMEKAKGIKLLMDELGATQQQVAKHVGFQRSSVANFLRLLDLPESIQAHVSRGTLSMGHARALLALSDVETMEITAEAAIKQGLSVRGLESQIAEMQQGKPKRQQTSSTGPQKKSRPVWLNELEEELIGTLSTPVSIKYGPKRSQIVIQCAGRDEFERLLERLKNC